MKVCICAVMVGLLASAFAEVKVGWNSIEVKGSAVAADLETADAEFLAKKGNKPEKLKLALTTSDDATFALVAAKWPNAVEVKVDNSTLSKDSKITDISPIVAFTAAKKVTLRYVTIDDLSVLAKLPKMEFLDLYGSVVKSFAPLAACPNLTTVNFYAVKGEPEMYQTLGALKQVKNFHGGLTKMTSLAWLKEVPQIEELKIFSEKIDSLDPISGCANLRYFRAWNMNASNLSTAVGDLKFLSPCTNLETLELPGSVYENLDALLALPKLKNVQLNKKQTDEAAVAAFGTALAEKVPGAKVRAF